MIQALDRYPTNLQMRIGRYVKNESLSGVLSAVDVHRAIDRSWGRAIASQKVSHWERAVLPGTPAVTTDLWSLGVIKRVPSTRT